MQRRTIAMVLGLVLTTATAIGKPAEDWPKWRGPRTDGISREKDLADQWPVEGPRRLWSVNIGRGYTSPIAVGGVVYAFGQEAKDGVLTAIKADSGTPVWRKTYPCALRVDHPGMRATPTVEGDRIYTFDVAGELIAWNRANGEILWRINVLQATGSKLLSWGCASSPVVDAEAVFVQCGSNGPLAVAVNKETGKLLWQSESREQAGYAPIQPVTVEGRRQLLVLGGTHVVAMDAATGKTIWSLPFQTEYKVNAATPLVRDDRVLLINEYKSGRSLMLQLGPDGAEKLWEDAKVKSRIATPILEGEVYYVNNAGTIECRRWTDGSSLWRCQDDKLNLGMGGSMVRAGRRMVTLSERGVLSLAAVTPQGCERRGQLAVANESEVWGTPLIYDGRLYVRTNNDLICLDISAAAASAPASAPAKAP